MAKGPSPLGKAAMLGVVLILIIAVLSVPLAYRQVPEGHAGVEKDWGAVNGNIADSGAHWKAPIMTSIQNVETRPRTYTMSQTSGEGEESRADAIKVKTVNGSTVKVDVTVRYRIKHDEADKFVSEWNNEVQMEERLIRPTIRTVLRDEASSLETTGNGAIYTQDGRNALQSTARDALATEFDGQPIVLEAVQIRNIDLPDKIDAALDEKEQAKQRVEVEQQRVKQEEAKKEQQIVQAEADAAEVRIAAQADANATRIRGEALNEYPIVLQQQYINALDEGTVYLGADGNMALVKDVDSETNSTNSSVMV
jgi:regulator of protease activity HflC (stomatin/prohibitin superfamily)